MGRGRKAPAFYLVTILMGWVFIMSVLGRELEKMDRNAGELVDRNSVQFRGSILTFGNGGKVSAFRVGNPKF